LVDVGRNGGSGGGTANLATPPQGLIGVAKIAESGWAERFVMARPGYPARGLRRAGSMWRDPVLVLPNLHGSVLMARRPNSAAPATRHPSQLLALAIGVVYTLVGLAGFFVTGFDNFASETDKTLIGFEINPLHNIVHLAIGLAGLALWRGLDTARTYGWLLVAGYGLAFLYGLFAAGNSDINFLSLNGADNGLHLVSAVAGLAIALWPADRTVPGRTADRST
jgi:Domain of unknown function (DUF4383)